MSAIAHGLGTYILGPTGGTADGSIVVTLRSGLPGTPYGFGTFAFFMAQFVVIVLEDGVIWVWKKYIAPSSGGASSVFVKRAQGIIGGLYVLLVLGLLGPLWHVESMAATVRVADDGWILHSDDLPLKIAEPVWIALGGKRPPA